MQTAECRKNKTKLQQQEQQKVEDLYIASHFRYVLAGIFINKSFLMFSYWKLSSHFSQSNWIHSMVPAGQLE